jgi:invasion protein IalB
MRSWSSAASILRRTALAVLFAGSCVAAQSAPGFAQEAKPVEAAPPNPQPWTINCSGVGAAGDLVCVMSQNLIAKNTGQRVLGLTISKNVKTGEYSGAFSLPHGLRLPDGIEVWTDDGQRVKHVINTADQNGSYATAPLDANMIASLKKGSILNVSVKSATGDEVIFQLSLNGFTAALAKI